MAPVAPPCRPVVVGPPNPRRAVKALLDGAAGYVCGPLSEQETRVLTLASEGSTNAKTAADLGLTLPNVKAVHRRLCHKLDAADRAGAVAAGFRLGLLS
jgi:DNA-binding NarL/FixJ family response regulator